MFNRCHSIDLCFVSGRRSCNVNIRYSTHCYSFCESETKCNNSKDSYSEQVTHQSLISHILIFSWSEKACFIYSFIFKSRWFHKTFVSVRSFTNSVIDYEDSTSATNNIVLYFLWMLRCLNKLIDLYWWHIDLLNSTTKHTSWVPYQV